MAEEELRPQHETLQARDKVVLKMTRDGNLLSQRG